MRQMRLPVTRELLEEVLHMPPDMHVVGAGFDAASGIATLVIEHPDFRDITPPEPLPSAKPLITHTVESWRWMIDEHDLGEGR